MTEKPAPTGFRSFEESLTRLETIVSQLEAGKVPLEDSIRIHTEGLRLKAYCAQLLREAELKLERIVTHPDGVIDVKSVPVPDDPADSS